MNKRSFFKTGLLAVGASLIPRKLWPLEFYPTISPAEWAILYSTWCGSSRDAAVWISEGMDGIASVFDVRENPDLSAYRHIVLGGSIRAGKTSGELQEYIARHKESISTRIRGMFAVCGNMRQPVTQGQYVAFFDQHLSPLTGVSDVPKKVFPGRITWGLMDPAVREQMKSFPGIEEYDNLKRSECMAFGREILMNRK